LQWPLTQVTDSDDELDLLEKIEQVSTEVLPQLVDDPDDSDTDGDELNINKHSTSIMSPYEFTSKTHSLSTEDLGKIFID
jgi:hypothetical protein